MKLDEGDQLADLGCGVGIRRDKPGLIRLKSFEVLHDDRTLT